MSRIVASLAAVLLGSALVALGCGSDGAEPGAPTEDGRDALPISLVLDFQPNAVHAGIYAALSSGPLTRAGVLLEVREPGSTADAPKLLEAGRTDLAVMDVNDLGIARERGAELVAVGAIVQRPLAAVIAADRSAVAAPGDLAGARVGVTGLPSDDAVLDTVLAAGDADPEAVERTTIGFDAVPLLAAGQVDAATAFWNAEGVILREQGVATRELRVDDYGAPTYPELVLVTTEDRLAEDRESIDAVVGAFERGYREVIADPLTGLEALAEAVPELDGDSQTAQLQALLEANAFSPPLKLDPNRIEAWAAWALETGILSEPLDVEAAFDLSQPAERP